MYFGDFTPIFLPTGKSNGVSGSSATIQKSSLDFVVPWQLYPCSEKKTW